MRHRLMNMSITMLAALLLAAGCTPFTPATGDAPGDAPATAEAPTAAAPDNQAGPTAPAAPAATDPAASATPSPRPTLVPSGIITRPVTREAPPVEVAPTPVAPVVGEVPEKLMADILDDVAGRSGVETTAVTVLQAEYVVWSDGAIGCPQPGQMYTQALVPGYRIVLLAGGQSYDYHAAESGHFILCQNKASPIQPEIGPPDS